VRLRSVIAAAMAVVAVAPSTAAASPLAPLPRESMFQDDTLLVYNTPLGVAQTLDALHSLGVDRVRVSLFWNLVAPAANSRSRPRFDAGDPAAYPAGAWDRYDRLLTFATARGIGVDFNVTDPAPLWATAPLDRARICREDKTACKRLSLIAKTFRPSASEFGAFVQAAATRYSGSFVAPAPTLNAGHPGPDRPLPRVDYWSIWNEPDQAAWLSPQWVGAVETAPAIYRSLVDAAYGALLATGHRDDTILVGETAPKGLAVRGETRSMRPLHFIRQLYCLDDSYHRLQGAVAAARGCPADASGFAAAHPGLFQMTGFAHHPYELTFSPSVPPTDPDSVTIANLGSLSSALDRILGAYGRSRAIPLYLTEFGYQSNPPSPLGVSLGQQAAYLNQSEFIAYTDPDVRTLSQFLLRDDAAVPGLNQVARLGATFQTGLELHSGRHKPAYAAYRLPVYVPTPRIRRGHLLRVWGFVRVATYGSVQHVQIQLRRSKGFRTIAVVATTDPRGYLDVRIHLPGSGQLRLAWTRSRQTLYSRLVSVRVS
jgi:hypothetical protein